VAQTHTTVRHYKEAINDQPPEIAQAEEAIQKSDFAGAETLLKKALEKDPNNDKDPNNYTGMALSGTVRPGLRPQSTKPRQTNRLPPIASQSPPSPTSLNPTSTWA
jgi:hypothetical protein